MTTMRTIDAIYSNIHVRKLLRSKNIDVREDLNVTGNLVVGGELTLGDTPMTDFTSKIVGSVMDALPFGPLNNCHGCNSKSYGFSWDATVNGDSAEREMCLECLYNCMLVERVKMMEFAHTHLGHE